MGSILSGIVLHGPTCAFGGTFLQFSDYMRPAVRLASLMDIDTIYIWTHDSIGLGEDGPTHQPIEHLAALRAIPRPVGGPPGRPQRDRLRVDARCWTAATAAVPSASILTRQGVPILEGTDHEGVAKGGYVLGAPPQREEPDVVLIGTGSELQLAVAAQSCRRTRTSSAAWYRCRASSGSSRSPHEYRDSVLPPRCRPGRGRGRQSPRAGTNWSATPARSSRSSITGNGRRGDLVPRVRVHPGSRRRGRRTNNRQLIRRASHDSEQNLAALSRRGSLHMAP